MNLLEELDEFIKTTKDAREIKRALAAKLRLEHQPSQKVQQILQVSQSFVSHWKNRAIFEGVEALRMQYKGSAGYLKAQEKEAVIQWIRSQDYVRLQDLVNYLKQEYQVIFESRQSYYALFHEAKVSWKKTQKTNPAKEEKAVEAKKKEIEDYLLTHQQEIAAGERSIFMIDECHFLSGDRLGHAWGRTDKRIEIPLKNEKERQTYYGALDYFTKEFIVQGYEAGNTENTIKFIEELMRRRPSQKITLWWDGATYHRSQQLRAYLESLNQGLEEEDWRVTCRRFAPNAPEQNPVEDIWLQAKNFVRSFYHICSSFKVAKWLFEFFLDGQIFDFPKIYEYGIFA